MTSTALKPKAKKDKGFLYTMKRSPKEIRAARKQNQGEFWSRLGVTQSGGSRYESGRDIPEPTRRLLELVEGSNPLANLAALRGTTVEELIAKGK